MFDLTREERKVLVFLFAVALAGMGLSYAAKKFAPVRSIARLDEDFGKIDINSADKDSLKSVPGIGERLAGRILEYRQESAGFNSLEELENVNGFTAAKVDKIKNYITVR